MRRFLIIFVFFSASFPCLSNANDLPVLNQQPSSFNWFLSTQTSTKEQFDLWKVDSGYRYSVIDSFELYIGTRLLAAEGNDDLEQGFLSGLTYHLTEKISFQSTLLTRNTSETNSVQTDIEVSSRLKITNKVDLHATIDVEDIEQVFQLGIGFSF